MRTFRFITEGQSVAEAQQQTITCHLYLEPSAGVRTLGQAEDCSCYTPEDCAPQCQSYF